MQLRMGTLVVACHKRCAITSSADAHTSAQVLHKMWKNGTFAEINGCVSTGKEANVYHASTQDGTDLAVKIYKTSILVFKDRERCDPSQHLPLLVLKASRA